MKDEVSEAYAGCLLMICFAVFVLPFFGYLAITWLRWLAFWLGYEFPV